MAEDIPLISVIVPHLNQEAGLEACLASLDAQTFPRSRFEVIVVDNGSRSVPESVVACHPRTILLQELRPGPGMARNRGITAAKADALAFIDADCRAHPEWLSAALDKLRNAPDRTILGGDVQIWRSDKDSMTGLEAYESVFAYRFKLYIEQRGFSGTGNLVVRHRDFETVGPFKGISVAEDIDWGNRARAAGYTFRYVPEMIVYHPARHSLRELFVKWDRHIRHAANIGERNVSWQMRWVLRALAILFSPLVDWTKVVASERLNGKSNRAKAILVLTLVRSYRAYRMISVLFRNQGVVWNRNDAITKPAAEEE